MVKLTKKQISDYQNGNVSDIELANALLKKYPVTDIAIALIELLAGDNKVEDMAEEIPFSVIPVTQGQMNAINSMFRVKGTDGRGRKPKKAE